MSLRVLVIGHRGQLAQALIERARVRDIALLALGRETVDLAGFSDLPQLADDFDPTIVINAAAYTGVDKAESDARACMAVNAHGAGCLAAAAARRGLGLLHLSTDYVYDGSKSAPYVEDDPVAPLGVYGASKLAGEVAVRQAHAQALIFRTAWVYSPFGGNFVKTMLRLSGERDQLSVVADQVGSPSSAHDIADALLDVAGALGGGARPAHAIYHLAGGGETSWHGLACAIFEICEKNGARTIPVAPITTRDYPTPAKRPANSRLDCARLSAVFGVELPYWRDSLERVVVRLLAQQT